MNPVVSARWFLTCIAVTVDGSTNVHIAFALTKRGAEQKLMRQLEKFYS